MSKAILVLDETPATCGECRLCNTSNNDDYYCDIIGDVDGEYDGIDQRCPLKPLPKGHGDLKDAERLKEVFRRNTGHDYHDLIDIAPTIIEADKTESDESVISN